MKRYRHVGRRVAVLGLTGAAVVAVAASPAFAKSEVGLSECVSDNRGTGGPLLDTIRLTHRGSESFRAQLLRLSGPDNRHPVVDRTTGTTVVTVR